MLNFTAKPKKVKQYMLKMIKQSYQDISCLKAIKKFRFLHVVIHPFMLISAMFRQ